MASIHLHSSGRSPYYQAKFRDAQGLIRVKSTKQTSPKEALKVAFAYEDSAAAARNGMLTEAQARRVISQAYEIAAKQPLRFCSTRDYLTNWVKANYATKSKGTAERYERVVLDFLEFIGARAGVDLRHIAPKDVEGFRNNEYRLGKSASSVNLALKALNIPFNLARRQVLIEVNPVEAVELLPKDGEERIPFTTQQLHTILKTADTEWKGMVLLGYYTGARLEVCAKMKWGTVDFETPLIRFTPNKVRRGKKAKEIVCPMHAELAEYLRSLPGPKHPNSFILPHLSSRKKSGKTGLSETFQSLLVKAGIDVPRGRKKTGKGRQLRKLGFHSLRHTFNSDIANAGVNQEVRKHLTGHSNDETNDIYTHLELAPLTEAIAKLPGILAQTNKSQTPRAEQPASGT